MTQTIEPKTTLCDRDLNLWFENAIKANSFDHALAIANGTGFALTTENTQRQGFAPLDGIE